MTSGQRRGRWSGVPLEDRQARRRGDLVGAGIPLLGNENGPAVTVRAVCRGAGLTERYFYESFGDRDDFAAIIVPAGRAEIVRALQFAAVRAFLERLDAQRIMAATHAALGRGRFSLWDSHEAPVSVI